MSDEFQKQLAAMLGPIQEMLDQKIPREAVRTRKGGKDRGGNAIYLSYVEGHYVIDRLNKVFGHLNWASETLDLTLLPDTQKPSYRARVRITVRRPDGVVVSHDGIGYGSDKSDMNPHEMAIKEAETDAIKRAAMKFGMSMGLALYDKEQTNVADDDPDEDEVQGAAHGSIESAPAAAAQGAKRERKADKKAPPAGSSPTVPEKAPEDRTLLNRLLGNMAVVADKKRVLPLAELKKQMTDKYGTAKKEELSDEQAAELYTYLRGQISG